MHNKRSSMFRRILHLSSILAVLTVAASGQQVSSADLSRSPAADMNTAPQAESKRILGIIPNFRTSPSLSDYKPLSSGEKFRIASEDAFDPGTFALSALFAGHGQMTNANRSFGQGAAGFSKYLGAAYGDFAIGDYLTEAVFPSLLHQDPRYFRSGSGSGWSRMRYAAGQIFFTHGDTGKKQFNFSEILGNSAGVAISTTYYADNRTASDAVSKLGVQLGIDMASNILKEFWPDLQRKFSRKHRESLAASPFGGNSLQQ